MDRESLIARKHEVRRQLERAQASLTQLENAAGPKQDRRRFPPLQNQTDRLIAEESNIPPAIDQANRS